MGVTKTVLGKGKSGAGWTLTKLWGGTCAIGRDLKEGYLDEVHTPIREHHEERKAKKAKKEEKKSDA